MKITVAAGLYFLVTAIGVAACSPGPSGKTPWNEVGSLDGGAIRFVQVDTKYAHDAGVYREAAENACGDRCIQVGFFAEGAPIPAATTRREFFAAGGWANYDPIAVYMGSTGEFTRWDCDRIGAEGAPGEAMCSGGQGELSLALHALGSRSAYVEACGMPPTSDRDLVAKFAATQGNSRAITDEFEQWYRRGLSGPDDPSMCPTVAVAVERSAVEGRKVIQNRLALVGAGKG